jgi:hypothetical protein
MVADEETFGPFQKIDVLSDLDLLISSCDSEPLQNFL